MPRFPANEARAHIERLERVHDVEVRQVTDWKQAEANWRTRQVWIPDPTTAFKYAICLHEFGHVLDKISAKVMRAERPECEAAAWKWAIRHARPNLLDYMTTADWNRVGRAWLSHVTERAALH